MADFGGGVGLGIRLSGVLRTLGGGEKTAVLTGADTTLGTALTTRFGAIGFSAGFVPTRDTVVFGEAFVATRGTIGFETGVLGFGETLVAIRDTVGFEPGVFGFVVGFETVFLGAVLATRGAVGLGVTVLRLGCGDGVIRVL